MVNKIQPYNNQPQKFSNILLNSFYLIFLIYFHPSAWRKLIYSVDSSLNPDFRLSDLSLSQRQNKSLRNIIFQCQIIAPFFVCLIWVILSFILIPIAEIKLTEAIAFIAMVLMGSIGVSITSSIIIGFALGVAGGCAICLFGGVAIAISAIMPSISGIQSVAIVVGLAGGGISGGVALGLINTPNRYSINQQISGAIFGTLIGFLAGLLSGLIGAGLSINESSTLNLGLKLGLEFTKEINFFYTIFIIIVLLIWGFINKYRNKKLLLFISPSFAFLLSIYMAKFLYKNDYFSYFESVFIGSLVGLSLGIIFSILFGLSREISIKISGPISGAIAGATSSGGFWFAFLAYFDSSVWILGMLSIAFALTMIWWRPLIFYPINTIYNLILYRLEISQYQINGSFLKFHSAFWDEHQFIPLIGIVQHVVIVFKRDPNEAKLAIEYLYDSKQRWAAQAAQIELDLITLESCVDLESIKSINNTYIKSVLETEADAHFREFIRISEKINDLYSFGDSYYKHCALEKTKDALNSFIRELTRSRDKFSKRCRPIALKWYRIIDFESKKYLNEVNQSDNFPDFYSYGKPLPYSHHAFIGREKISAKIEKLIIDTSCPPLLLYGQRRIGKTSLLINLGELLPHHIIPAFIDLQGPIENSSNYSEFLYSISEDIILSAQKKRNIVFPSLSYEQLIHNPFKSFTNWIDEIEILLDDNILLITFDEYESLSRSFESGCLDEDKTLGFFRYLIQHKDRIKFIFSGSHQLIDFPRWSNYLINLQVIYINYFTDAEALKLIYLPRIKKFDIEYTKEALDCILYETHKHPALLQLLCSEIIRTYNRKYNRIGMPVISINDVELSIDNAIRRGALFFQDIEAERLIVGKVNTIEIIRFIASKGKFVFTTKSELLDKYPYLFPKVEAFLVGRDVLEKQSESYRVKIEMVRKWFTNSFL